MYYSNGNYEAFADPKKPEGVDKKSAYIICFDSDCVYCCYLFY